MVDFGVWHSLVCARVSYETVSGHESQVRIPGKLNIGLNIGVWHSLVVRMVREQITDYERKNSKTAENP